MCPIFENVDISLEDIGSYMKQYGEEHGFMKQPRLSLISSHFGKQQQQQQHSSDYPLHPVLPTTRFRGNTRL